LRKKKKTIVAEGFIIERVRGSTGQTAGTIQAGKGRLGGGAKKKKGGGKI